MIISKADNIKDDMVEHAVNSTLRARKTHNLVVDPYQCVMKQRLAEFLRCTIRYHKFRASYFDDETKEWLLRCVLEAGLKGKYVNGDLHLERPADLRPVSFANTEVQGPRKELPLVANSPTTDDLAVVGHFELEEPPQEHIPGGGGGGASKLMSYALDDDEDLDDDDLSADANGTETCASSCGELGTSYEMSNTIQHCLASMTTAPENIKVQMDIGSDDAIKVHFIVINAHQQQQQQQQQGKRSLQHRSRKGDDALDDLGIEPESSENVRVTLTPMGEHVSVGMEVACVNGNAVKRGLLAELTTVTEERSEDDGMIPHAPLIANGLHERNAEILKLVFLDLFDSMEKLQDTDSFRGEIEIDPTEYVVPVPWVRQQIRDIARHLFLEIVQPSKRRRAMKIRIRKRAR